MDPLNRSGVRLAALFAVLVLASCKGNASKSEAAGGKPRVSKLAAVIAAKAPFADPLAGLGSVGSLERVDLKSEIAGRVLRVEFREGAAVRKGQVLVRLDDAETKALRDRAAARARLASASLARVREQLRVEAASAQQVEAASADSAVAAAELVLADVALERTRVKAPFDGVAGLCDVSTGQWIQPGQILTEVVSRRTVRLDWSVPERLASVVAAGQPLSWKDPASGRSGKAVVDALDPSLDETTRSRRLRASCRTGCDALLPGAAVELLLPGDTAPALSVPSQALSGSAAGLALFVFRGGKATLAPVAAGRRSVDRIEILSGLAVGDTVLFPGASPPKPGAPVEIARILGAEAKDGASRAKSKTSQRAAP